MMNELEVVTLEIAGKMYAFAANSIQEVILMMEPTPMPEWPSFGLGLIDLRGELVPLVDIAPMLGHVPSPIRLDQHILLVLAEERVFGIVVDKVHGVAPAMVRSTDTATLPEAFRISAICGGVITTSEGTIVLLDAAGVFRTFAERLPLEAGELPAPTRGERSASAKP